VRRGVVSSYHLLSLPSSSHFTYPLLLLTDRMSMMSSLSYHSAVSPEVVEKVPSPLPSTKPEILTSSYEAAIGTLNSLQSNASMIETSRRNVGVKTFNIPRTRHYLRLVGITDDEINQLNIVHVTGTKGKGSTCAFTEFILRNHGVRTGFYSSPHLVAVRERIRINGQPLSEEMFAHYFWQTYGRIKTHSEESIACEVPPLPSYFMFLTIMAFNVFVSEGVEAAVVEVGIGGEYDCTNVIRKPVVTGITSLALDHTVILGDTIDQIAWQKSGIFKKDVPAFSVQQASEAMRVLEERAKEKESSSFTIVPPLESIISGKCRYANDNTIKINNNTNNNYLPNGNHHLPSNCCNNNWSFPSTPTTHSSFSLGIPGDVQAINASLALRLSFTWLSRNGYLPQETSLEMFIASDRTRDALRKTRWPGRCQVFESLQFSNLTFFLDGAHTKESIESSIDCFSKASLEMERKQHGKTLLRILLFNCTGYRNPGDLLTPILSCRQVSFDTVLFSPNKVLKEKSSSSDQSNFTVDPLVEERKSIELANLWRLKKTGEINGNHGSIENSQSELLTENEKVISFQCLTEAVNWIHERRRKTEDDFPIHVLVTGSLHLVGGVLGLIDPQLTCFQE